MLSGENNFFVGAFEGLSMVGYLSHGLGLRSDLSIIDRISHISQNV